MIDFGVMEKSVLKTLVYADIFDYPLKAWEIHKWLIEKNSSLGQVERVLKKLIRDKKIGKSNDYFFLRGRKSLVEKREQNEKVAEGYLKQLRYILFFLKLIPFIKLVGISGSLAMKNTDENDDIDLFLIVNGKRLWVSRFLVLTYLELIGKRRSRDEKNKKSPGKICVNIILTEDNLSQSNSNIYLAHEVLQMMVIWQKNDIYEKYLEDNEWVFKYLPNWLNSRQFKEKNPIRKFKDGEFYVLTGLLNWLEIILGFLQLRYMGKPEGKERISDKGVYFHPYDYQDVILKRYNLGVKRLIS